MPDSTAAALNLFREITSLPTAPFAEHAVAAYARQFVADRPHLRLSRDRFSNLLIERRPRSPGPRWVFSAHMDHPGMVARKMVSATSLDADFFGGVFADYVAGARVRFFSGDDEIAGTVTAVRCPKGDPRPSGVTVRVLRAVLPGSAGMFDLGTARMNGRKMSSRAIDDLGGLASALAMLEQLGKRKLKSNVAVLLTRAEEIGFIGCLAAVSEGGLLRKSDRIIGIETSQMQPYAKQRDGVILRIGDRTSIFHSALTYFISTCGTELAKKDKSFKFQRALMPGGTCESTVYDAFGYIAGAVCVPLGNYHNMDREMKKLAAEYIDREDWLNMVKLFVALAERGHTFEPGHGMLKKKLAKCFARYRKLL